MKQKLKLCEINEEFDNDRISKMVFGTKKVPNGDVLYDFYEKSLYRNDTCFFGKQHALELSMYHDDFEVCNLLGSKSGKHKVHMFYY